jgi:tRNA(adenine34) deaminase
MTTQNLNQHETDLKWMAQALKLAQTAGQMGEVPVGAVLIGPDGQLVSEAFNRREIDRSPTAHAELRVLEKAATVLGRWRLTGCTLYVTLEPCVMCAGAIVLARVDRVVYGTKDLKAGACESLFQILADPRLNHRPRVDSGVLASECGQILSDFFRERRNAAKDEQ